MHFFKRLNLKKTKITCIYLFNTHTQLHVSIYFIQKETLLHHPKMTKNTSFNESVNISEEMSKTSIWMQVKQDSTRRDMNGGGAQQRYLFVLFFF